MTPCGATSQQSVDSTSQLINLITIHVQFWILKATLKQININELGFIKYFFYKIIPLP